MKRIIEIGESDLERIREIVERENKTALSVTTRGTAYITIADSKPYEERPQGDCISREALKDSIYSDGCYYLGSFIKEKIDNAPTVERPKGKWIRYRDNPHQPEHIKCSNCGQYWSIADHDKIFDICFKCGAKMKGDTK